MRRGQRPEAGRGCEAAGHLTAPRVTTAGDLALTIAPLQAATDAAVVGAPALRGMRQTLHLDEARRRRPSAGLWWHTDHASLTRVSFNNTNTVTDQYEKNAKDVATPRSCQ